MLPKYFQSLAYEVSLLPTYLSSPSAPYIIVHRLPALLKDTFSPPALNIVLSLHCESLPIPIRLERVPAMVPTKPTGPNAFCLAHL